MADDGSILVTVAAGQLGEVGRTVTNMLLQPAGFRFAPSSAARTSGRLPCGPPAPRW